MNTTTTEVSPIRPCMCRFLDKEFCPKHGTYKIKDYDKVSGVITYYPVSTVPSST